ncbi:MAG TPA: hypothetical protein VHN79_14235 [Lacunisphaera sp.]|nr:hypothetical protein [Lacunisphaera sp.]
MVTPAFLPRLVQRTLAVAVMVLAACGASAQWAMYDAFKVNPAASLDVSGTKGMAVSKKILVPTVYLRIATSGSVFVAKQKGKGTASAKATYTVEGHDREALMALAKKIEADYVAQLREAGWEVLTYADIASEEGVKSMERQRGEGALNFPLQKDSNGALYAIVAPSAEQTFKPAMQGPTWPFRFIAKERDATVLIPQIDIVAPQVWAETSSGYKSVSAEIKHLPGMNMNYAMVQGLTPKGGGVLIKLKGAVVNTTEEAGAFTGMTDKTPGAANGLSKGLAILGGGGSIKRASGAYTFAIDREKFNAGVRAGADTFLVATVKALK